MSLFLSRYQRFTVVVGLVPVAYLISRRESSTIVSWLFARHELDWQLGDLVSLGLPRMMLYWIWSIWLALHEYMVFAQHYTHISYDFRWTQITPTPELIYHDCGGGFQCARLELPLDWNATEGSATWGEKYNMAIVKLPARVPVTDPRYGGPVLMNPGGPGVSGTLDAVLEGAILQTIIDAAHANGSATYVSPDPSARYFDIIGFDPRAVGNSTPWYACTEDPIDYYNFMVQRNGLYLDWVGGQNDDFENLWARTAAFPLSCIWDPAKGPQGSKIANFSGTTYTARDLVEFAERHGEWREKQAYGCSDTAIQERLKWQPGEEPILFHGGSYGTLMGATLAAMQPHRVHRFLLDGVTQASEAYTGILNSDALGGDPNMERFFELCALSGPKLCPFWAGNKTEDNRDRLQAIFNDVRANPIPVPGNKNHGPDIITIGDIKQILSYTFEEPLSSWPAIAAALAPLSNRNGSAVARLKQDAVKVDWKNVQRFNESDPTTFLAFTTAGASQFFLITWFWVIEGGETATRYTKQRFIDDVWAPLYKETYWAGDYDATIYQFFSTWPYHNKWVFGHEHAVASNVTKNPILFASDLVDAETSVQSAVNMTAAFAGSGLIILDGEGHEATAEPSLCHAKRVRYYFQTGRLPEDRAVHCLPYMRPFGGKDMPGTEKLDRSKLSKEDEVLLQAAIDYAS